MFEGSLVESRGLVVSETRKWTTAGSIGLQCVLAGALVAVPLLRPEVLRIPAAPAPLVAPFLRRPPIVPVQVTNAASSATAMSVPAAGPATAPTMGRPLLPTLGGPIVDGPEEVNLGTARMGDGPSGVGIPGLSASSVGPVVRARQSGPVNVSKGVTEGLLLAPIRPMYPAIARASRTQGTVVLEAIISKTGRIESLHAVSGPGMLRQSALDAVSQARYRPYMLDGEPTEVETTVTVVFSLGG